MYFILFLTTVRCYIFERFFCFSWIRTPGKATGGSSHVTVWLQCTVQEKWSMVIGPLLCIYFNPLRFTVTFLYPLKTSGKRRFSDVFRGYKNVTLDINGLMENFIFCAVTDTLDIANPTAIAAVMAPTKSIRRNKSFLLTTLHHCYKLQHSNLLLSINQICNSPK